VSCTIGTVSLDNTPIWIDKNWYSELSTEVVAAINGVEIICSYYAGQIYPMTLQSTKKTGWLKGSTVDELRLLSSAIGAYYTLNLNGICHIVRFRNEQPGGAIQMETLVLHSNPGSDDWYFGTIYLMCVS
jgi:hypothetical protein